MVQAVQELKRTLVGAGLEIYRTRGERVHIAERVRENLLMDSRVWVDASTLRVGCTVRAQRSDFPNDGEELLFERARRLGELAGAVGFVESTSNVQRIADPGDPSRTIDLWCEVELVREAETPAAAVEGIRAALALARVAAARTE